MGDNEITHGLTVANLFEPGTIFAPILPGFGFGVADENGAVRFPALDGSEFEPGWYVTKVEQDEFTIRLHPTPADDEPLRPNRHSRRAARRR